MIEINFDPTSLDYDHLKRPSKQFEDQNIKCSEQCIRGATVFMAYYDDFSFFGEINQSSKPFSSMSLYMLK